MRPIKMRLNVMNKALKDLKKMGYKGNPLQIERDLIAIAVENNALGQITHDIDQLGDSIRNALESIEWVVTIGKKGRSKEKVFTESLELLDETYKGIVAWSKHKPKKPRTHKLSVKEIKAIDQFLGNLKNYTNHMLKAKIKNSPGPRRLTHIDDLKTYIDDILNDSNSGKTSRNIALKDPQVRRNLQKIDDEAYALHQLVTDPRTRRDLQTIRYACADISAKHIEHSEKFLIQAVKRMYVATVAIRNWEKENNLANRELDRLQEYLYDIKQRGAKIDTYLAKIFASTLQLEKLVKHRHIQAHIKAILGECYNVLSNNQHPDREFLLYSITRMQGAAKDIKLRTKMRKNETR